MTDNQVRELQPGQMCRMIISGRRLKVVRVVNTAKKQCIECLDVSDPDKSSAFVVRPDQYNLLEVEK